jgi:hypothetical protein
VDQTLSVWKWGWLASAFVPLALHTTLRDSVVGNVKAFHLHVANTVTAWMAFASASLTSDPQTARTAKSNAVRECRVGFTLIVLVALASAILDTLLPMVHHAPSHVIHPLTAAQINTAQTCPIVNAKLLSLNLPVFAFVVVFSAPIFQFVLMLIVNASQDTSRTRVDLVFPLFSPAVPR